MAGYIKKNSAPDDEIFGESGAVPLIALLADRKIALNQADTNTMLFSSGLIDKEELFSRLKTSKLKFVISRPYVTLGNDEAFIDFLKNNCGRIGLYREKYEADFFIFVCNEHLQDYINKFATNTTNSSSYDSVEKEVVIN